MTTAAWKSWEPAERGADLYDWQAGRCAWCGCNNARLYSRSMSQDHCHDTGLTRGWLCAGCNQLEGVSRDESWDAWREGDTPAQALGYFEVYRNASGVTPLSPQSALTYYTRDQQRVWWSQVEADVAAGGRLPHEAPWTAETRARRDADFEYARQAIGLLFTSRPKAEAG